MEWTPNCSEQDDDNRILSSFPNVNDTSDSAPLFFARLFREHRNCTLGIKIVSAFLSSNRLDIFIAA